MDRRLPTALLACACAVLAFAATGSAKRAVHMLRPNPADASGLVSEPMDPVRYDDGSKLREAQPARAWTR